MLLMSCLLAASNAPGRLFTIVIESARVASTCGLLDLHGNLFRFYSVLGVGCAAKTRWWTRLQARRESRWHSGWDKLGQPSTPARWCCNCYKKPPARKLPGG